MQGKASICNKSSKNTGLRSKYESGIDSMIDEFYCHGNLDLSPQYKGLRRMQLSMSNAVTKEFSAAASASGKPLLLISINQKSTDADLVAKIIMGNKYSQIGFDVRLSVDGFGDDPRELHQIPAAVESLKSWCRLGGLSALIGMSPAGTLFDCPDASTLGMSADTLWASTNGFGHGDVVDHHAFVRDLEASNEYCDAHYTGVNHYRVPPVLLCGI